MIGFSALQRAEIAEMAARKSPDCRFKRVSVLFNEPKLLKLQQRKSVMRHLVCFSALQRAEIAEIALLDRRGRAVLAFQCSSTSRNC